MVEVMTLSFDEQVEALVHRGVASDEARFRAMVDSARLAASPQRSVLAVSRDLVPVAAAAARIERRERPVVLGQLEPADLSSFVPIGAVDVPEAPAYVAIDIDLGAESRNVRPEDALRTILNEGRSPLTLDEGIALVLQQPEVIAAEITGDSPDFGHLGPMITAAKRELVAAGISDPVEVVVADAGYWHHPQIDELALRAITMLIPPDAGKRKDTRPGWDGGRYAFMRRVLQTDLGKALYAKCQETIEPVFANTKFNRRIDRFARRGRSACRSEWRLITATDNLLKLHKHHLALATA